MVRRSVSTIWQTSTVVKKLERGDMSCAEQPVSDLFGMSECYAIETYCSLHIACAQEVDDLCKVYDHDQQRIDLPILGDDDLPNPVCD